LRNEAFENLEIASLDLKIGKFENGLFFGPTDVRSAQYLISLAMAES
jgi:hypothetical protein